jgi:hypothetical protein
MFILLLEIPPPELPPVQGNPDEEPAEIEINAMDANDMETAPTVMSTSIDVSAAAGHSSMVM